MGASSYSPKRILLKKSTLTIADDTPATLNIKTDEYGNDGYIDVVCEAATVTAGMASVDIKWQPMAFKRAYFDKRNEDNMTAVGSTVTAGAAADLDTVGKIVSRSITVSAAESGDSTNYIHGDGIQISLTGDTSDDGTVYVTVYSWAK